MTDEFDPGRIGRPTLSEPEKAKRRKKKNFPDRRPPPDKKKEMVGNVELNTRNIAYLAREPGNKAGPWLKRRLFLENREQAFFDTRKKMYDGGHYANWGNTFWPAAKEFFSFKSMIDEQERCKQIEAGVVLGANVRAAELEGLDMLKSHIHTKDQKECTYYDEVKWAFTNWPRFVKKTKDGFVLTDEGIMQQEAPTTGSIGLIYYAFSNLSQFQGLCAKVLAKVDGAPDASESETERVCDDSIDALRSVIDGLNG